MARDELLVAVAGRAPDVRATERMGALAEPGACFVTLREAGQLRGCIGGLEALHPLAAHVRAMTAAAALQDPRFRPVVEAEVHRIEVSLSVLTPTRRVSDPAEVLVGRHGLVVSRGTSRGVLLPQVAVDQGWERETFLTQTCLKAGLPEDAWRDLGTRLEVFEAEVFGEGDGHGNGP